MSQDKSSTNADGAQVRPVGGAAVAGPSGQSVLVRLPRHGSRRYKAYGKLADDVRFATAEAMRAEYIEEQRVVVAGLVADVERFLGERRPSLKIADGDLSDPLFLVPATLHQLVQYLGDFEKLEEQSFGWPIAVDVDLNDQRAELLVALGELVLLLVRAEGHA